MNVLLKDYLFVLESDEKGLKRYIASSKDMCFVVHEGLDEWIKLINSDISNKIILETDMESIAEVAKSFYKYLIISPNEISIKNQIEKYLGVNVAKNKRIYRLYNDIFTFATCSIPAHKVDLNNQNNNIDDKITVCLVTTLPRSGSTFFCDTFEQSGLFGHAREHIRQDTAFLVKKGFLNFQHFFTFVVNNTTTDNNVFQTKIIDGFFIDMYQNMNDNERKFVKEIFTQSKVIYLERENKISQAISAYKSAISGKYHSTDKGVEEFEAPYDYESLLKTYNAYNKKEEFWKQFILELVSGKGLYDVKYENFVKETQKYFFEIAEYCMVQVSANDYNESIYTKVSNKNSNELKAKFIADLEKLKVE